MTMLSIDSIVSADVRSLQRNDDGPPAAAPRAPATTWQDLLSGRVSVDGYSFDDHCMTMRMVVESNRGAICDRLQVIMNETFATGAQKVVSIQRGVAPSTVTSSLRQALGRLGLACIPSRVPFLLVLSAAAGMSDVPVPGALVTTRTAGNLTYTTLSLHDPRDWLRERLSSSEAIVTRLRFHGASLDEIASRRERSVRTIANQLAAAYRKVEVSGRSELLVRLTFEYLAGNVPVPCATPREAPVHDLSSRHRRRSSAAGNAPSTWPNRS
jgi:DNA-binding CsgD family transcriptional regulator